MVSGILQYITGILQYITLGILLQLNPDTKGFIWQRELCKCENRLFFFWLLLHVYSSSGFFFFGPSCTVLSHLDPLLIRESSQSSPNPVQTLQQSHSVSCFCSVFLTSKQNQSWAFFVSFGNHHAHLSDFLLASFCLRPFASSVLQSSLTIVLVLLTGLDF